jgi:hypothetical protein
MFNVRRARSQKEIDSQEAFLNEGRVLSPSPQEKIIPRNQGGQAEASTKQELREMPRYVKTQSREFDKIDRITVQLLSEFSESELQLTEILSMIEVRFILLLNLRKE